MVHLQEKIAQGLEFVCRHGVARVSLELFLDARRTAVRRTAVRVTAVLRAAVRLAAVPGTAVHRTAVPRSAVRRTAVPLLVFGR